MKSKLLTMTGLLLILSACSHSHDVIGFQEGGAIPQGTRVRVGAGEVKEGDKVDVYQNSCHPAGARSSTDVEHCQDKTVGTATVVKVLGRKTAIVTPDGNLKLDETMTVKTRKDME